MREMRGMGQRLVMAVNGEAEPETRALGILAGYLWAKFQLPAEDVGRPLVTKTGNFSHAKFQQLRAGTLVLAEPERAAIKLRLREIVRRPENLLLVRADYEFIRPILMAAGLDREVWRGLNDDYITDNQVPEDVVFLNAFDLDVKKHTAGEQDELYKIIGGLWYVIRVSTRSLDRDFGESRALPLDDGHRYNVSLLSVKPRKYYRTKRERVERVETHLLHFSLRSRLRNGDVQIFRGRVLKVESALYFLGNKRDYWNQRLMAMTLRTPSVTLDIETDGVSARPIRAMGVIMTVTGNDALINCPVACHSVPMEISHSDGYPDAARDDETSFKESRRAENLIDGYERSVGILTEWELSNLVMDSSAKSAMRTTIDRLKVKVRDGMEEGYFAVDDS